MSSPDPCAHKRIGRGVRNFDSTAWDIEKQNAVLFGNYAKATQNPAMKHHLLSTGNKLLPGEALSVVREEIRDTETGLANPASVGRFRTPTGNAGIHEISSAPQSC